MIRSSAIAVLALAGLAAAANAGVTPISLRITEVSAYGSGAGNTPFLADWFELTNTGTTDVDITGWRMDDSSNSFASSVALSGITSIPAGASVIFLESSTPATTIPSFVNAWFGGIQPAGLQIGSYTGSGVGLGTGGDAVNVFTSGGAVIASVSFGASPASPNFATFDNTAGINAGLISQLSVAGVNGAFVAPGYADIGSPGVIPAPGAAALLGLGGLLAARRRRA